jgi:Bacteriophage terminase large (ATPase) subunit an d inactivated derivatives
VDGRGDGSGWAEGVTSTATILAALKGMSPEQVKGLHALRMREVQRGEDHPLWSVELWDRRKPRTSQLRAARLLEAHTYLLISGGNRTGKTELGAILTACALYGRQHPDVVEFCRRHRVKPEVFPTAPSRVWASALTFGDPTLVMRSKLETYLPPGTKWYGRWANQQARAVLPNGSEVTFKADQQGREKYQADNIDWLWTDEEHSGPVCEEARMRLIDRAGRWVNTMTPLKGKTCMWDWFACPDGPKRLPNTAYAQLSIHDNPWLTETAVAQALAGKGAHERAARERGEFVALEGRVYPDWNRDVHVLPLAESQALIRKAKAEQWPAYESIDFGTRNPFCWLRAVHDQRDDTLIFVDCHYQAEWLLSRHAEVIRRRREWWGYDPQICWADPEDLQARRALSMEHDIGTAKARKDIRQGINAVSERLAPDAEGKPHLLVLGTANLAPFVREIEGYIWQTRKTAEDQPEKPLKSNDHAMDAGRYLAVGVSRVLGTLRG